MDAMKTGELITAARKERNMTQKELAQALHVSAQAVSKWECGRSFPDVAMLEPLGRVLGVTVSELLAGERDALPREELVRDSLRMSLGQLGRKVRTWRGLFVLTAGVLVLLTAWKGFAWLRDNTKLIPQRQTVITYRESTPAEDLAADIAGLGSDIYFYDVIYADGTTGEKLQLELWTHEGLEQTWELARAGNADPDRWPRKGTIALAFNVDFGADGEPDLFHSGAALVHGRWNRTLEDVPYLSAGFGFQALEGTVTVDREHGAVLGCWYLDTTGTGRWQAVPWLGDVEAPEVEEGQALLLARLNYEYE